MELALTELSAARDGWKWIVAVKTLASKRNGQTIFDNIRRASEQIDASRAASGLLLSTQRTSSTINASGSGRLRLLVWKRRSKSKYMVLQ
jgi:hypothetical protein